METIQENLLIDYDDVDTSGMTEQERYDYLLWQVVPWENLPLEVRKRLVAKREANSIKSQGTLAFAPGFSFDSDSAIKLYQQL